MIENDLKPISENILYERVINVAGGTQSGGTISDYFSMSIKVVEESYDIVNNTGNVRVYGTFKNNKSWTAWQNYGEQSAPLFTLSFYDNKTNHTNTYTTYISTLNGYQQVVLFDFNRILEHNSDGSLIINLNLKVERRVERYYFPYNTEMSTGNINTITIPRSSVLGDLDVYIDESTDGITIPITKYVSSFYNKLNVIMNGIFICSRSGIENGDKLIFTQNELNTIYAITKNVPFPVFDVHLITYNNIDMDVQIGNLSVQTMDFIFINQQPRFISFDYEDINETTLELTNLPLSIIPKYSNIKITIPEEEKAIAQKGANIIEYTFQDGKSEQYKANGDVSHVIEKYDYGNLIEVNAIDSRTFSSGAYYEIYRLIPYNQEPMITSIAVNREDGASTTSRLNCSIKLWDGSFREDDSGKNEITYFGYRVKLVDEEWENQTWYDKTNLFKQITQNQSVDNLYIRDNDDFFIHSNGVSGGIPLVSYDIQFKVSDGIGSTIFNSDLETVTINDGKFLDTYHKTSTGYQYAINGVVDTSLGDGLQIYGNLCLNGLDILNTLHPIGEYYETSNKDFDPNISFCGKWELEEDGTVLVSKSNRNDSRLNADYGSIIGSEEMQSHTHGNDSHSHGVGGIQAPNTETIPPYHALSGSSGQDTGASTTVRYAPSTLNSTINIHNSGSGNSGNIQPSKIVYRWHRVA